MTCYRFALFMMIPLMLFALDKKGYTQCYHQAHAQFDRANHYIDQVNKLAADDFTNRIQLLQDSLFCYQDAIHRHERICKDFMKQRTKPLWQIFGEPSWALKIQKNSYEERWSALSSLEPIQVAIKKNLGSQMLYEAYQEISHKIETIQTKLSSIPRKFNNADVIIAALLEAAETHNQAASIALKALIAAPDLEESDRSFFQKLVSYYQTFAEKYEEEAKGWPDQLLSQKLELEEKISKLNMDISILQKQGLHPSAFELYKQRLSLLLQLLEVDEDKNLLQEAHAYEAQIDLLRLTEIHPIQSTRSKLRAFYKPIPSFTSEYKTTKPLFDLWKIRPYPLLDKFVQEMKGDALSLAQYVTHEIQWIDREEATLSIHRNPLMTFLEGRGNAAEICQLLVYLLRQAKETAFYDYQGHYASVILELDKKSIALFPWMKESLFRENDFIYDRMPKGYQSAEEWISHYLQNDPRILRHIGPDGNDSAGVLFLRFVQEELRTQGLSFQDIGIYFQPIKRHLTSWEDFPTPSACSQKKKTLAQMQLTLSSHENPHKQLEIELHLIDLTTEAFELRFNSEGLYLSGMEREKFLKLDPDDLSIDIKITYQRFRDEKKQDQTLSLFRGETAALCFHLGGKSSQIRAQYSEQAIKEKDPQKHLHHQLALIGSFYFEKCGKTEELLAQLHGQSPKTSFAAGLVKYSSHSPLKLDMVWFSSSNPIDAQYHALLIVDRSSNEHHILREIFNDPYALSAVKLLQLACLEKQKEGSNEQGFLTLSRTDPKWHQMNPLSQKISCSEYAYAYMTPGKIASADGKESEMALLIIDQHEAKSLISFRNQILHGGVSSSPYEWDFFPSDKRFNLTFTSPPPIVQHAPSPCKNSSQWTSDIRPLSKTVWESVCDPIDVVTGAFYIDEVDLSLPGSFPLTIRRNYNSQNSLHSSLGCGWKLSLNPTLIEQNGLLYAAEEDGTVIAYRWHREHHRWEVYPEDNPLLYNLSQKLFQSYIENNVIYSPDGSQRVFQEGLLQTWVNASGAVLTFFYEGAHLKRIENSKGQFYGFHYNSEGMIREIYTSDGRRVSYHHNIRGELIEVSLPHGATISYDYDHRYRMIRETKPHGKVVENIYDNQGRVIEQRASMGPHQEIIPTAWIDYQKESTTVTDAAGSKVLYKIHDRQIYKIIDPLGHETLQAWFIDEYSWFDPVNEIISPWNQPGGYAKSLKSSTDKRGLTTHYLYDCQGNITEIAFMNVRKKMTYNLQNLCVLEEVEGISTFTEYDAKFPYLVKRREKWADNLMFSYIDFNYNSEGQLQKEDRSGSITLWEYDKNGFVLRKTFVTGSDDENPVIHYDYNNQGNCRHILSDDGTEDHEYDIMGNCLQSTLRSLSGQLLSVGYFGYNLHHELIWQQGALSDDIIYFDYHSNGKIKALRQGHHSQFYEYDSRALLVQKINKLGYSTYREYDALERLTCETKGDTSTYFSYEPGGLISSITLPSGATTYRNYTLNGLLQKETYPDGTSICIDYDAFGRPVKENKQGIIRNIHYEDAQHRIIYTYPATGILEIEEFDMRGNLIRFIDAESNCFTKTYDGLNRIKSETDPTGMTTKWNYQGNTIICTLPNGEKQIRCEGKSQHFDHHGNLIRERSSFYDPLTRTHENRLGDTLTLTQMNIQGLPQTTQTGSITTTYEYDAEGRCITSTDGEGNTTYYSFDQLNRLIQKQLPDGQFIEYTYDLDSHLIECLISGEKKWEASYDSMGRKVSDGKWNYIYQDGYLVKAIDPMGRSHHYLYDSQGRVTEETVDDWTVTYRYNRKDLITHINLKQENGNHSQVIREYDNKGRILIETIYLNGKLLPQIHQNWTLSGRSLQIGQHQRHFHYQNNQLTWLISSNIEFCYHYKLDGSLETKTNPLGVTQLHYNSSNLPNIIITPLHQEELTWDYCGKLTHHNTETREQQFTYTPQGYLNFTPYQEPPSPDHYDQMGQQLLHQGAHCEWDPWGRLIRVTCDTFDWQASYDGLGRRLQTRYNPSCGPPLITTSFYDPEEEFQEIGIDLNGSTFWKIYGPRDLEAIQNEENHSILLNYNALGQLTDISSTDKNLPLNIPYTPYGPQNQGKALKPHLPTLAKSFSWRNLSQDPTGLIWMGARYYDPHTGHFLSPDPLNDPECPNPYIYANGDPINYVDLDGRCASEAYKQTQIAIADTAFFLSNTWDNPRFQGGLQAFGGLVEMKAGAGLTFASSGMLAPIGGAMMFHGADQCVAGMNSLINGVSKDSFTSQCFQKAGLTRESANWIDNTLSMSSGFVKGSGLQIGDHWGTVRNFAKSTSSKLEELIQIAKRSSKDPKKIQLLENKLIAEQIARGHAFEKHVIIQKEFPGFSQDDFKRHIFNILNKPTERKQLAGGRTAYWDDRSKTLVIHNPNKADCGTAFKPGPGKAYYDETLK